MTTSNDDNMKQDLEPPQLFNEPNRLVKRGWARFLLFSRKVNLSSKLEVIFTVLALVSIGFTYNAISKDAGPISALEDKNVRAFMIINMVMILFLIFSISRRIIKIYTARKSDSAGSRLHARFVGSFSLIAIIPAIVMGIFSSFFLETQIQNWFSDNIRQSVNGSFEVAERYMAEHEEEILSDLTSIDLQTRTLTVFQYENPIFMDSVLRRLVNSRNLDEALIIQPGFDADGKVLEENVQIFARASSSPDLMMQRIPASLIEQLPDQGALIEQFVTDNLMIGVTRLESYTQPTYVIVTRLLDQKVVQFLEDTLLASQEYASLESQSSDILTQFTLFFIIIALLLLLIAIWVGLSFATRLVNPLSNLVSAAERVSLGDYAAKVKPGIASDEVAKLGRVFNRMTDDLSQQQQTLQTMNTDLETRRRFLEEVLEGVSAGVIGVAEEGKIYLPNRSACALLGRTTEELVGQSIYSAVPEMKVLLEHAAVVEAGMAQGQVTVEVKGESRTLLVRVAEEREGDQSTGMVITFDDLTEQLADQRTAAWADVARRIAHEIKNPLTPIQLSAERLKRKYMKEIETDPAVFSQCTDTIIRQVGDLRKMVDEFSSFARMPVPRFQETDLVDVVRRAVFLQDVAHADLLFTVNVDDKIQAIPMDERLMGQAVTNLIKNATESIETRLSGASKKDKSLASNQGKISVSIEQNEDNTVLFITDNGIGLPQENPDKLLEPYVTTRAKGTGLGLAIVRKIIEDHGGRITLSNNDEFGANARIVISHTMLEKKRLSFSNTKETHAAE